MPRVDLLTGPGSTKLRRVLPVDARAAIGKASAVFPVAFVALEAAITAVWVTSDGRRKNEKKIWQRWLTHPIFLVPVLS